MNAINLEEKLSTFSQHYQPRTAAQFNIDDVMVVKVKGPFTWHKHDETDDFFLVLKGRITIQMREGNVSLGPGEVCCAAWRRALSCCGRRGSPSID